VHPLQFEPFERGLLGHANGMVQLQTARHIREILSDLEN
jgi:hypothetical protein